MLSAKYLAGIFLIVLAATAGWFILGATLVVRTEQSDSRQRDALSALWGSASEQRQPVFLFVRNERKNGRVTYDVAPASSRITVDLALDQRRKGLLWYNTYGVTFSGTYRVTNRASRGSLEMAFTLPSETATYDDVAVLVDGRRVSASSSGGKLLTTIPLVPGRDATVPVGYRSRGLGTWQYRFANEVTTVRDLLPTLRT